MIDTESQVNHKNDQFYKIKICPFFLKMKCSKGTECTYAHNTDELRVGVSLRKTQICSAWRKGQCVSNNCRFAHGIDELRYTEDYYKTKLCKFWLKNINCPAGVSCRHAHGDEELRERNYRLTNREKKDRSSSKKSASSKISNDESIDEKTMNPMISTNTESSATSVFNQENKNTDYFAIRNCLLNNSEKSKFYSDNIFSDTNDSKSLKITKESAQNQDTNILDYNNQNIYRYNFKMDKNFCSLPFSNFGYFDNKIFENEINFKSKSKNLDYADYIPKKVHPQSKTTIFNQEFKNEDLVEKILASLCLDDHVTMDNYKNMQMS